MSACACCCLRRVPSVLLAVCARCAAHLRATTHRPAPAPRSLKTADLAPIFIAACFEEDGEAVEAKRRESSDGLCRFEWLEAVVRLAIAKFVIPKASALPRLGAPHTHYWDTAAALGRNASAVTA